MEFHFILVQKHTSRLSKGRQAVSSDISSFFSFSFFSERAEMAVLWPHAPEIPLLNLSDDRLVLNIFWSFAALFFHRSMVRSVPLPQNHCFQIIQPSFLSMERFVSETFSNFCVTFS